MDESNVPSEQGSSSTISKLPFIQESAALTPQKGDRSLGVGRMSPNLVGLSTTYKISSYRTGLQCTHLTMAETEPCPRWFWEEDDKTWQPYNPGDSDILETIYRTGGTTVELDGKYTVNVSNAVRTQTRTDIANGSTRRVMRATWFWEDSKGKWHPHPEETAERLEAAYHAKIFYKKVDDLGLGSFYVILEGTNGLGKQYASESATHSQNVRRGYEGRSIPRVDVDGRELSLAGTSPRGGGGDSGRHSADKGSNYIDFGFGDQAPSDPSTWDKSDGPAPAKVKRQPKHGIWKEAFVGKKSGGLKEKKNIWKNRYLIVTTDAIGVYVNRTKEKDRFPLLKVMRVELFHDHRCEPGFHHFLVKTYGDHEYCFRCGTKSEAEEWVDIIEQAIDWAKNPEGRVTQDLQSLNVASTTTTTTTTTAPAPVTTITTNQPQQPPQQPQQPQQPPQQPPQPQATNQHPYTPNNTNPSFNGGSNPPQGGYNPGGGPGSNFGTNQPGGGFNQPSGPGSTPSGYPPGFNPPPNNNQATNFNSGGPGGYNGGPPSNPPGGYNSGGGYNPNQGGYNSNANQGGYNPGGGPGGYNPGGPGSNQGGFPPGYNNSPAATNYNGGYNPGPGPQSTNYQGGYNPGGPPGYSSTPPPGNYNPGGYNSGPTGGYNQGGWNAQQPGPYEQQTNYNPGGYNPNPPGGYNPAPGYPPNGGGGYAPTNTNTYPPGYY